MKPFQQLSKAFTLAATALIMFTASCKKDNHGADKPANGIKLKRVEASATNYTSFEYNSAGNITKIITAEDGETDVIDLAYQNNKLFSLTSSDQEALKFTYATNGLTDRVDMYQGGLQGANVGYFKFSYNNAVLSDIVTYGLIPNEANPVPLIKTTFEYYANGDIKTQRDLQYNWLTKAYVISESTTYEYDTHDNPLYSVSEIYQLKFEAPSKHNPVKATVTDENNDLVRTTTYAYTYNSNGYPTQAQTKVTEPRQPNPTVSTVKFSYQ